MHLLVFIFDFAVLKHKMLKFCMDLLPYLFIFFSLGRVCMKENFILLNVSYSRILIIFFYMFS